MRYFLGGDQVTFAKYLCNWEIQACKKWGWTNLLFINNMAAPWSFGDTCMVISWSIAIEFQVISPNFRDLLR